MSQEHEAERLRALARFEVVDTSAEDAFDRLTTLARAIFDMPIALVTLVDQNRQWIKSASGMNVRETAREVAFCSFTIMEDAVMIVEDAVLDDRFSANPLVTGPDAIRFYAGAPLITRDGFRVGSLCVLDRRPRTFTSDRAELLAQMAAIVVDELELRLSRRMATIEIERRRRAERQLNLVNMLLEETASADSHATAVRLFLRGLAEYYNAECGLLYLMSSACEEVLPIASYTNDDPENDKFLAVAAETPLKPATSLAWTVLASGQAAQAVEIADAQANSNPLLGPAAAAGLASALIIPLRDHANYVVSLLFRGPPANLDLVGMDAARLSAKLVPLLSQRLVAEELDRQQALAGLLLDNLDVPIVGFDLEERYTLWSAAMARRTGLSQAEVVGRTTADIFSDINPTSVAITDPIKAEVLRGHVRIVQDVPYLDLDGSPSFYDATYVPLRDPSGEVLGGIGILNDATERRSADADRAERQRLEAGIRFEQMSAASPSAIICLEEGRIVSWNDAATLLSGYSASEMMERSLDLLLPRPDRRKFHAWLVRAAADSASEADRRWHVRHKTGSLRPVAVTVSSWHEGNRLMMGLTLNDVSRQEQDEKQLEHLARTDFLTGLANRTTINQLLIEAENGNKPLTAILLDLDGFKHVNDSLGHDAGDLVLKEVARRLRSALGEEHGTLGRLGGDEFIILLPSGTVPPDEAAALASVLQQTLTAPLAVGARSFALSATAGIAVEEGDHDGDSLLTRADLALYSAKAHARGGLEIFAPELKRRYEQRRNLEQEVQRAIEMDEFVVHYQPQVALSTGELLGAEALIRWQHPQRGLLPPSEFLHVIEGPAAVVVGTRVLQQACAQGVEWLQAGRNLNVAVNLFAEQLTSGDLPALVRDTLAQHGLPAERLELELTETIAISNEDGLLRTLDELRQIGVRLTFDDFGTGYASLSALKRFPIDRLKIDRSFVSNLDKEDSNAAIVEAVLALSSHLGLRVIAEGIETRSQETFLRERGCWAGQGYLYGRPAATIAR